MVYKHKIALIWLACLLALCAGVLALRQNREPTFEGRSLGAWLSDLSDNEPPDRRQRAARAVRAIGSNGLPMLSAMLRSRDSRVKKALIRLADAQTIVE